MVRLRMSEIQVGDGNGIDQFKVEELLCALAAEMRKTSTGERLRWLLLASVDAGAARFNQDDDVIVNFPGQTATFPSGLIGEPPGPWTDIKVLRPQFNGSYWIMFRGKSPFVASYDNKGWEMVNSPSQNRINSQHVTAWKPRWGVAK
jgi:hypothetical protein